MDYQKIPLSNDKKANELAKAFVKNFDQFIEFANTEITDAAPIPK